MEWMVISLVGAQSIAKSSSLSTELFSMNGKIYFLKGEKEKEKERKTEFLHLQV